MELSTQLADYENSANISCTKHVVFDGTFFIVNYGTQGYWLIKFYEGQYRIGGLHSSLSEAYSYAISYM